MTSDTQVRRLEPMSKIDDSLVPLKIVKPGTIIDPVNRKEQIAVYVMVLLSVATLAGIVTLFLTSEQPPKKFARGDQGELIAPTSDGAWRMMENIVVRKDNELMEKDRVISYTDRELQSQSDRLMLYRLATPHIDAWQVYMTAWYLADSNAYAAPRLRQAVATAIWRIVFDKIGYIPAVQPPAEMPMPGLVTSFATVE